MPSSKGPVPGIAQDARPLYTRVRDALLARIASGEWAAGDSLPSEQALSVEYDVAQGTLRKAVDLLVAEGKLVRRHGRGTFVAVYDGNRALSHLLRLVGPDGRSDIPTARIVSHVKDTADDAEEDRLRLRRQSKVIRIERVRYFGDQPVIVERLVLPFALFPGLEPARASELPPHLYEHFGRKYGILVRDAVEDLRAVVATPIEAALLRIEPGAPLLEIDRLIRGFDGRPIEWRISRCCTRNYSFRTVHGGDGNAQ